MALPKKGGQAPKKQFIQEVVEPEVQTPVEPEVLMEFDEEPEAVNANEEINLEYSTGYAEK